MRVLSVIVLMVLGMRLGLSGFLVCTGSYESENKEVLQNLVTIDCARSPMPHFGLPRLRKTSIVNRRQEGVTIAVTFNVVLSFDCWSSKLIPEG